MASFTEHYNLKKPGYDDFSDIADINGNFNIIDTALQEAKTAGTAAQTNLDTHTTNKSNPHNVTKAQLGLGNVDNTSDVNKPVSMAQQAAIDAVSATCAGVILSGRDINTGQAEYVTAEDGAEIFNDYRERYYATPTTPQQGNIAVGAFSHAEGKTTTAKGEASHTEGQLTFANGDYSHAEGNNCYAQNFASHAEGFRSVADGDCSHASGYFTAAKHLQFVAGKKNSVTSGCESTTGTIDVNSQSASHSLFIIGNGTENTYSNAFRITADGQCRGTKAFVGSGADFAEYFEWLDGNPNNEDRRGKFVTLDGEKIKLANDGDYILGVVSASGAFIGNSQSEDWQGKYLKDVYGDWLTQEVTVPENTDETGKVIPEHTSIQYVVNPDFNPETEYIAREFRKEWSPVGMLGQVVVVDDGTCIVNGYCKPSANGIGTVADNGYRVLKRLDSTHIKVLVR